jgi:thymidylate synthase
MHSISGRTADEVWRAAAALAIKSEVPIQSSRAGDTLEVLHLGLHIEEPSQRWVVSRAPPINPAFALIEVFWIVAGRKDAAFPTFWNRTLSRYCGSSADFHGAYGYRLRNHFGVDQLDRVYRTLCNSPDSRQCVLQFWDPAVDLPNADGSPAAADIPCNVTAFPKIRNGKLEWMQVIRSNDVFRGMPYNFVQFTSIQEMLSGWLGVAAGGYHQLSDSLHVYAGDLEAVRSGLSPVEAPPNTDSFALDRTTWDLVLPQTVERLDRLAGHSLSRREFEACAFRNDLPRAYENAILVAAADAARRRRWDDLAADSIDRCTNSLLVQLWSRWRLRWPMKEDQSQLV